ncbi:substrate-binding domain-containing protein, partial [Pseudomonas syringae pv. tagetis]
PEWNDKLIFGSTVQWPAGVGGKGNDGVSAYVKQIKGSIGYVEYSYATVNKLSYTQLKNAAAQYKMPDPKAITESAYSTKREEAKAINRIM